ncbi:general stress protein [Sporosarcina ureilytica]|uniref:General stress protein n=1 Tax=Sporosarcina ureilytica TaxID=298596 RepID=A0A1D8JEG3_9BACL|nr:general stress protein [Sporosarcina ureilytica]AOV07114.1 general stress protein [Sporosarcina ureilytica]
MTVKKTVENVVQAKSEVEKLVSSGYSHAEIYIFAHDEKRGNDITEALDTEKVGLKEEGVLNTLKNLVSSRGDELRSKMEAAGLTTAEAETAEEELDQGKLVIIANQTNNK